MLTEGERRRIWNGDEENWNQMRKNKSKKKKKPCWGGECCGIIRSSQLSPEWQWSSPNNTDKGNNTDIYLSTETKDSTEHREHKEGHPDHTTHSLTDEEKQFTLTAGVKT